MLTIHQLALYLHIFVGAFALFLFWVPVFTRKGNRDHKRFGRYFSYAMYTIAFSGLVMSSLDLMFPLAMHAGELNLEGLEAENAMTEIRSFGLFLFSLSVLVLTSTRHGWLTILYREDREPLRHPLHVGLNGVLILVGVVLFSTGLNVGGILFMIFGVLQIVTGLGNLRYIFRKELRPKEWWIQHLGGLIGSGIGAYTAFAVFGGRRFFQEIFTSNFESFSVFLWIAPGVIGSIAIILLTRHYRNKFGGAWITRRATLRSQLFS